VKIALCETKPTPRGDYILDCLRAGFERHDENVYNLRLADPIEALDLMDVAVMICAPNPADKTTKQMIRRHEIWDRSRIVGRPILVIDSGFFHTQADAEMRDGFKADRHGGFTRFDKSVYYQLGWNGFKRTALLPTNNLKRFHGLSIRIQKPQIIDTTRPIIIIGQPDQGVSCWDVNLVGMYRDLVERLREICNCTGEIRFRQHPRIFKDARRFPMQAKWTRRFFGHDVTFSTHVDIAEDLRDIGTAFVYSSNAAVQTVIRGIPTFVESDDCPAWPVSCGEWKLFPTEPTPPTMTMIEWAQQIAASQWNCSEMANGSAWKELKARIPVKR